MEFGSINWPPTQENFESGKSFVILLSEPDEENTTQTDATTAAQTSSATTTTTTTTTAAGSTAAPGPGLLAVEEAPSSPPSSWATLVAVLGVLASCGLVLVLAFTRRPGSSKGSSKDTSKDSSKESKDTKDTAASHPREGAVSTLGHQETVEMDEVGWRGNKEFLLLI